MIDDSQFLTIDINFVVKGIVGGRNHLGLTKFGLVEGGIFFCFGTSSDDGLDRYLGFDSGFDVGLGNPSVDFRMDLGSFN